MSEAASVSPFDFRTPGSLADETEARLAAWQRTLCEVVSERWNQHLHAPAAWSASSLRTFRQPEALEKLPESAFGIRVALGPAGEESLFVFDRQTVLAIVFNALGETGEELPDARDLTELESSLAGVFMQELSVATSEASPGAEPLHCEFSGWEFSPRRTRMFPQDESVVVCQFGLQVPNPEQQCFWLIRQALLREMFSDLAGAAPDVLDESRQKLEEIALEVPFPVVVRLGRATLRVSELTQLQVGDVIVLDKLIHDSLDVCVADAVKFRGRPGRIGSRQGFQIESVVDGQS